MTRTTLPPYTVGESDTRPWGSWKVLDLGTENGPNGVEEYCIKEIIINAGGMTSLQSHALRREEWTVLQGEIEVTRNNDVLILRQGDTIHIPMGAMHRIANNGTEPATLREVQRGTCREDDITRYKDVYGRV